MQMYPGAEKSLQNGEKPGFHTETGGTETGDTTETPEHEEEQKESRGLLIAFCIVAGTGYMFSMGVQMYMSSQITVIERAFGLSSSKSGILLSAGDIGFIVTVLFASHFLSRMHIPRMLGICILIDGIAGVLISLPHFIVDEKMASNDVALPNTSLKANSSNILCIERAGDHLGPESDCHGNSGHAMVTNERNSWIPVFIALMMVVQGVVKSSRSPLSMTYIDNNGKRSGAGLYIGIYVTFSIFGPTLSSVLGGVFSKLPVDLKETMLKPEDPRWVGAWWLGFIVFGGGAILSSIPAFFFPAGRKSSTHREKDEAFNASCCNYLKDLPRSVGRVIVRPVYVLIVVSILCQMFSIMSLAAFGPKYLEHQFQVPTWKANIILGAEKLVTTTLGTFIGGILTRRLKLEATGCLRMVAITHVISLLLQAFNFWFGCDVPIRGLESDISNLGNMTCDCTGVPYRPMCAENQTFFSPCHAGCQIQTQTGFGQCMASTSGDVTSGLCSTGCTYLIPYIGVNALSSLIGTVAIVPNYLTVLRSVKETDRTIGLGLLSFFVSLLVFLPAPIVYGKLFDSICLVWNYTCGKKSNCSMYDVKGMRIKFNSTNLGLRVASAVLVISALCFIKKEPETNQTKLEKEVHVNGAIDIKLSDEKAVDKHVNGNILGEKSLPESEVDTKLNEKMLFRF